MRKNYSSRIRNIVFDIGNVLACFRWKDLFGELGFTGEKFDRIAAATILHPTMWPEFDRSLMSAEEIIASCVRRAPEYEQDIRRLFERTELLIEEYAYSYGWIKELKERGYKIYLLSNYGKTSFEAAVNHGRLSFMPLIDGSVISYEVKIVKPEPGIYEALIQKYNLVPEECVFLDDREDNVEAAIRCGFHGIVAEGYEQASARLNDILLRAELPMDYDAYVFDLYGTLVDIHTDEEDMEVWEKLSLFYGYYGAVYTAEELKAAYGRLVTGKEKNLKSALEQDPKYSHEASPEIEITEVFQELFTEKGIRADKELAVHAGQFFRVLTTEYVRLYQGTQNMLVRLREAGKRIYLLSNAQRIFTEFEMRKLDLIKYFDGILISSDYRTKKPDKRFFDVLISEYRIDPAKALFVGNDSRSDIKGAQAVGFDTYYVKSDISPEGDMAEDATYCISDFKSWA